MGWPLLARSIVVAACLGGCAALAGITDGSDLTASTPDGGTVDDASPTPEREAGADGAPGCTHTSTVQPSGAVHAKAAAPAPAIDGTFDDWACIDRIDVGPGVVNRDLPLGTQSVEFALQWTPTDLYFYAHAITVAPGFDNTGSQVFANDSIHLIIGRDPPPATTSDGKYRTGDHQLTFDYKGRFGDYVNGTMVSANLAAAVKRAPGDATVDFEIEARITPAQLGLAGFAAGQKLVMNIMLVDAKAQGALGFRVWRLPALAACPCTTGCCERIGNQNSPTCDMRCTETLQLD
ncbi:MAG: hypothetical protein JWP87_5152 [Labilithrix sp.]|nr:hypothetical protein [Labilithrix sp.]